MRAARRKILLVFVIICMAQLFTHFQLPRYVLTFILQSTQTIDPFLKFCKNIQLYYNRSRSRKRPSISIHPSRFLELPPFLLILNWTIHVTDKRTDVRSRDFMIWKINYGLWSGLDCEIKGFGPIMSNFWGQFFKVFMDKKLI